MIKRIKEYIGSFFGSLKLSMLAALLIGMFFAIISYFAVQLSASAVIENVYLAEENKDAREEGFAAALQSYVKDNEITSEDTAKLAEWAQSNKYLYLMIYKDDQLFFESGDIDDNTENKDEPGVGEGEPDGDGDSSGAGSGITIKYPTREELIKYAEESDSHIITTADEKLLVVSMADFTEYLYYDLFNIVSILLAVMILVVTIMVYFSGITRRIARLASDVSVVAEGDMDHVISSVGTDELATLSKNVENMRSSIVENLEKERAALDANAELITSMSHDIRTPLTVLLGYLDMMRSRSQDPVMQEYIAASENTANRLKKLSDDLFNYFVIFGGGADKVELGDYDAPMLFDQLIAEYVLVLRESGYEVSFSSFDEGLSDRVVTTDPPQLMRIIENVFSNILKYADKAHPVCISSVLEENWIKLCFSNKISKTSGYVESNGIGLKTCKKLAEALGIEFSTEEGDTEFCATLLIPSKKGEVTEGA